MARRLPGKAKKETREQSKFIIYIYIYYFNIIFFICFIV